LVFIAYGQTFTRLEWDRRNVPFQISRCRKAKAKVSAVRGRRRYERAVLI
jgi:hypothetical protein